MHLIERTLECKEKNLYVQLCDEYGDLNAEQSVIKFNIIIIIIILLLLICHIFVQGDGCIGSVVKIYSCVL